MCGRFARIAPISEIISNFYLEDVLIDVQPSYNIAPGSSILSVVLKDGRRALETFRWGLVPHWAKEPSIGYKMINARGETVHQKPGFRSAFKARRCLIVASGFYEWKKEGRIKIPHYIRLAGRSSFAFAGIHESWISKEGTELRTCAIITTGPNDLLRTIHDRMPVILSPASERDWLDPAFPAEDARALLAPYPAAEMEAYPVSALVNSPRNDIPDCIAPV